VLAAASVGNDAVASLGRVPPLWPLASHSRLVALRRRKSRFNGEMYLLREQLAETSLAAVQMDALLLCLLKIAAVVRVTARSIWLELSASHASASRWPDSSRASMNHQASWQFT
jgi:hypothetical protein